jgi:hypothetical protein
MKVDKVILISPASSKTIAKSQNKCGEIALPSNDLR